MSKHEDLTQQYSTWGISSCSIRMSYMTSRCIARTGGCSCWRRMATIPTKSSKKPQFMKVTAYLPEL